MMEENSINIPINLVVNGGTDLGRSSENNTTELNSDNRNKSGGEKAAVKSSTNVAKAIVLQNASKILSASLNTLGDITGNYVAQNNLQVFINEANKVENVIIAGLAGGVAGLAVTGTSYIVDKGIQIFNYTARLKRSEAEARFKQQRVYAENYRA